MTIVAAFQSHAQPLRAEQGEHVIPVEVECRGVFAGQTVVERRVHVDVKVTIVKTPEEAKK